MKRATLALLLLSVCNSYSFGAGASGDPRFYESLKRLDPATRLDQICDYEAMLRIDRDPNPYHPDRAKAEVISTPHRTDDSIMTNGGAFRSGGRWYVLSYTCKTSPDHLKVINFAYRIGKLIPTSEWPKYSLWR